MYIYNMIKKFKSFLKKKKKKKYINKNNQQINFTYQFHKNKYLIIK